MADGGGAIFAGARAKLKVVGFAGGGGSSEAIRMALNCDPDLAMNHWMTAVLAHQRHFPKTQHHCADIFDVDPTEFRPGERIAFGWFSPDCTDFSKAKGKAPRSERIRGLAWSVLPWAVARRIDVIMVENVEEFLGWGPVYPSPDDWRSGFAVGRAGEPIKALRGKTFALWKRRLEALGYVVEWRIVNAADFGAPTTRKRLYVIARCDGKPIVWPDRTHAPRKDAERLGLKPWVGACEIIDFSQDCPSLLMTREEAAEYTRITGKRIQRPVVPATQKRVFRGFDRYVVSAAQPYIVPITGRGWSPDRADSVIAPIRTILASRGGEFALVDPTVALMTSVAHGGELRAWDIEDPARTQTGHHDKALVTGTLVGLAHGEHAERPGARSRDLRDAMNTISAGGGDAALVTGVLIPRYSERDGQLPRCLDVEEPLATPVPTGNQGGLSSAYLVRQFGSAVGGRDIEEPTNTLMPGEGGVGGGKTQMISAFMAQANRGQDGRPAVEPLTTTTGRGTQQQLTVAMVDSYYTTGAHGGSAEGPLRVATAKARHSLVMAWLEQANTGMVGHEMGVPVSTIIGAASTQRLVEARLELDGGPIGRRDRVLEFLWSHAGVPTPEEWADPTGTREARLKFGLVILDGQVWMVVDIGLRMLTPAELAAAMGLPPGFDLTVDAYGTPISKTHQTQMIGNMVSPPPAAALIAANCPDLVEPQLEAAA